MNRNRVAPITVACCAVLLSDAAFAYVDPGTGSLLIQWLFGVVMAGFAVLNIYWYRAKEFFARKFGNTEPGQDGDEAAD